MENFRLKVFRSVAHHLNFRMAAEELFLTQPAVTQQIKALEAEFGVALFNRSGGKISLTVAGSTLLPFAEQLATLADQAREAVAASGNTNAGKLQVAASQTIGQYLLPRLIAGFLLENPRVEVEVLSGNTQAVLDTLVEGRAQVALIEGPALRQDVHVEPFMEDHLVCVVPAGHEWAEEDIHVEQLKQVPLLTRELGSGSRRIMEQALERRGLRLRDLHIRMTFDSTEGLLSAVEAGLGVAFVSRWAVRSQLALGTLKIARIQKLDLARMFSIATPQGPASTGLTEAFRGFLLQRAEDLAPRPTGRPRKTH